VDVSVATLCLDSPRLHAQGAFCGRRGGLDGLLVRGDVPWTTQDAVSVCSSGLLFAIVQRVLAWNPRQPLDPARKRLITVLRDEIAQPEQQPLRLPLPGDERLARLAHALQDDVGDDRGLEDWAHFAGMSRRTFMRAFSAEVGMSFGRWRQQARLFAALERLEQNKSVTEVALAVGYDSVSAFIEMFRKMLGTTPQMYFRSKQEPVLK
jgi:AraC-like DNA-binding protein